jgi:hypothetical protein
VRPVAVFDAVSVVPEAREAAIPVRKCAQVAEVRTVIAAGLFTPHQHRNSWWIWDDTRREHTACEALERDMFDPAAYELLICVCRRDHGNRQR